MSQGSHSFFLFLSALAQLELILVSEFLACTMNFVINKPMQFQLQFKTSKETMWEDIITVGKMPFK